MLQLVTLTRDDVKKQGMIPVVSYARISNDKRKDEHGVQDQHRINRKTAKKHGWVIVAEFTDNDKSAAKADVVRDDFESMLKALSAGRLPDGTPVRGLIVVVEDRLIRRPGDYERVVDTFHRHDDFVFADQWQQKDLYREDVESMGLLGAVFSRIEVRKIQRRMRNNHRSRAERGVPARGPRPFGWLPDGLTLHPAEAPLLRKAAREVLAGRSVYSIVMEWQRNGIKTTRGNEWAVRPLKGVLVSARICGWRELDGELVRGEDGKPVQGIWEPIISTEEWEGIRSIFDGRKGHFIKRNGEIGAAIPEEYRDARYLLTGILRCGRVRDGKRCNTKLRVTPNKHGKYHAYVCPSKAMGGCGGVSRRGDLVDEFVSEALLATMEEKEIARRKGGKLDVWEGADQLKEVEQQLAELDARWMLPLGDEQKLSNERFFKLSAPLERERDRLRGEQRKHEASVQRQEARKVIDVEEFRHKWYLPEEEGGHPLSVKRVHLREAFHAVIVHPAVKGRKAFNPDLLEPIWTEEP